MNSAERVSKVQWRDLVPLTRAERTWEITLPAPWLVLSIVCYERGWWLAALFSSFYFFLTGLRASHNAQHHSLGLSVAAHDWLLCFLSFLMLTSMHAVQLTHLHHHRHCLDANDGEGEAARGSGWRAILSGPLFLCRLHLSAWRLGSHRQRRWMIAELSGILLLIGMAVGGLLPRGWHGHFAAMLFGECLTAFFAVWTVHRGCPAGTPGRTQRGRVLTALTYSMFLHAEHHLFPAIPTIHLVQLARRLDAMRLPPAEELVLG